MKSLSFRKDLVGVQDELLRFAYKLTTDREEANDLLQETSLKALDNEDKYTPDTNFKGWMYTIMRNIFINNYRKVVRDQTFVDQTDNLYHLNLPQDGSSESTERAYDLKEMHRVVNKLPKEYRVPFAMHVSGFKYREIAEKLYPDEPKIYNLHEKVREMLQREQDPLELSAALRGHVITCDEIGCGVVPIEPNDENWREAVGRLCCALASEADAVIRVWAGVPQFIKGELK